MALYAFDGTWNEADERRVERPEQKSRWRSEIQANRDSRETNVRRIEQAYSHGGEETAFYLPGVGTRFKLLGKAIGGATGAGGKRRIREMYEHLIDQYPNDQVIDVAGFSRGSAMAVHFCHVIDRRGIPSRDAKRPRVSRWSRYVGWNRLPKRVDPGDVTIRFLGIFDMVPSFGVPVGPLRNRSPTWRFRTLPGRVEKAYHARALDEARPTFSLVQPRHEAGEDLLYSVWFRGVHSNVGGGYDDRGLSDITLAWMLEMFRLTVGDATPRGIRTLLETLQPDFATIEPIGIDLDPVRPDPNGLLGRPFRLLRRSPRKIEAEPLVHHSALRRDDRPTDYEDGKSLLAPIPQDRLVIYDPPMLRPPGRRQRALTIAREVFRSLPLNPESWLTVNGEHVFRSDHWIAAGPSAARGDPGQRVWQYPRQSAVAIIATWLLEGRPDPLDPATIPWTVRSYVARRDYVAMPEMTSEQLAAARTDVIDVVQRLIEHGQGPAALD